MPSRRSPRIDGQATNASSPVGALAGTCVQALLGNAALVEPKFEQATT
jgi:hypothetical protein